MFLLAVFLRVDRLQQREQQQQARTWYRSAEWPATSVLHTPEPEISTTLLCDVPTTTVSEPGDTSTAQMARPGSSPGAALGSLCVIFRQSTVSPPCPLRSQWCTVPSAPADTSVPRVGRTHSPRTPAAAALELPPPPPPPPPPTPCAASVRSPLAPAPATFHTYNSPPAMPVASTGPSPPVPTARGRKAAEHTFCMGSLPKVHAVDDQLPPPSASSVHSRMCFTPNVTKRRGPPAAVANVSHTSPCT